MLVTSLVGDIFIPFYDDHDVIIMFTIGMRQLDFDPVVSKKISS